MNWCHCLGWRRIGKPSLWNSTSGRMCTTHGDYALWVMDGKHSHLKASYLWEHLLQLQGVLHSVLLALVDSEYKFIWIDIEGHVHQSNAQLYGDSDVKRRNWTSQNVLNIEVVLNCSYILTTYSIILFNLMFSGLDLATCSFLASHSSATLTQISVSALVHQDIRIVSG